MLNRLFETEFPEDNSPVDTTGITQVLLYYSDEEAVEFKALCKIGIKAEYPTDFLNQNVQDFLLKILRQKYGQQNNSQ